MAIDFDRIIVSHTEWKHRFKKHIQGQEHLVASVVAQDHQCEIGKWFYGEGSKFSGRKEFDSAKVAHADFHDKAAQVVRKSQGLSVAEAEKLVGLTTDYGKSSSTCIASLVALRDAVKNW